MQLFSLIISIIMLYAIYYIFENYDLKTGIIINSVYGIITSIINNGFNILYILLGIIVTIIETLILYKIYNTSTSFGNFFAKTLLIGVVIVVILAIISFIIVSIVGSNGILAN